MSKRRNSHKERIYLTLMVVFVLALGVISLFTGAYDILGKEDGWNMFFITRVPRTISLMISGAAMSLAGLVMQLLTQNRFVEPTTTGTIEWAGLGLVLVYIFIKRPTLVQRMTGAILFSFIGTFIFFLIMRRIKMRSSVIVPIVGMMLSAVVSAITTFISLANQASHSLEVWFAGSFASVERGRYEYLWIEIIIFVLIYIYADRLTVAGLGEDIATNLGLNYNRIVLIGVSLIAVSVGVVSSVIGNLPFLGLIVPNIVSLFRGDNLRSNIAWVSLTGMATILICDILARKIIEPFEVPVSLILGTLGAVVFILLLHIQKRKERANG